MNWATVAETAQWTILFYVFFRSAINEGRLENLERKVRGRDRS